MQQRIWEPRFVPRAAAADNGHLIYAVSDRVDGPYTEPEENILLASQTFNGISCRTVEFQGKQMLMYTSTSRTGASDAGDNMMGVLSTPKELIAKNGGFMPNTAR